MIITGKEALELNLSGGDGETVEFFRPNDIEAGSSVNVVFLREPEDMVLWLQHNWWKNPKYSPNPGEYTVTEEVHFASLKEKWHSPDEQCPGFIMGSKGTMKYFCNVLVDDGKNPVTEKIFDFNKSIWNDLDKVKKSIQADFGDEAGITDKWLRIGNTGSGTDRYSVNFNGKPFKEHKTYVPKLNPVDYIKIKTFPEIVEQMREAGLPIDEKLAERGLNELGMKVSEQNTGGEIPPIYFLKRIKYAKHDTE